MCLLFQGDVALISLYLSLYNIISLYTLQILRLKAGVMPWQGRVEVFKEGEWGTVCDRSFDAADGNVVCRELGYGNVKTIFSRGSLGQGIGRIHLADCRSDL